MARETRKALVYTKVPVPQTDTGRWDEYSKANGRRVVTVSYTHLDVYKRQAQVHPFIMEKGPKFHVDLQGIGVKLLQDAGLSAENVIDRCV